MGFAGTVGVLGKLPYAYAGCVRPGVYWVVKGGGVLDFCPGFLVKVNAARCQRHLVDRRTPGEETVEEDLPGALVVLRPW